MDALHLWISQSDHQILSREEEASLARAYRAGDEEAKWRLVQSNQRLVYSIGRRYLAAVKPTVDLLDLLQQGNIGLIRAVEKFDPDRGYKLSTYATWWIRQAMQRLLQSSTGAFQIPVNIGGDLDRIRVAEGRYPDADETEIARRCKMKVEKLRLLRDIRRSPASFDALLDVDGFDGGSLGDLLAADEDTSGETNLLMAQILPLFDELKERERRCLELRFGLGDERAHSLEETGVRLGVTRERVRQIQEKALRQLRAKLAA